MEIEFIEGINKEKNSLFSFFLPPADLLIQTFTGERQANEKFSDSKRIEKVLHNQISDQQEGVMVAEISFQLFLFFFAFSSSAEIRNRKTGKVRKEKGQSLFFTRPERHDCTNDH